MTLSLASLTYLIIVHPFENRLIGVAEMVNETSIVLASYHLFWFSDYVSNSESELAFGWSIIGLILSNVVFNMAIFAIGLVSFIKRFCFRCFARRAAKKQYEKSIIEAQEKA